MCVFFIPFILDVRVVDVPVGITQEESHTGFLHLPSAMIALIFIATRIGLKKLQYIYIYIIYIYIYIYIITNNRDDRKGKE